MRIFLPVIVLTFITAFSNTLQAQVFPNPASLSTGQGPAGTLDPIWTVSSWFSSNPPNPMGLAYSPALINNNCAPGSWVNPASLPPPVNNGNWITNAGFPCSSNTNDGYLYFRLALNLPADCNGNSISTIGSYTLYLSGYVDNTISDVFVNGTSTGISGGAFTAGNQLNITLSGPWLAGINYIDVLVYNFPNGGQPNPYGLLLVANSAAIDTSDSDHDGFLDVSDQCPCLSGSRPNGCPTPIIGDTVICLGQSATLKATETGNTYLWSTGATTDSISVNPASNTIYSLTITNPSGFRDSGTINVIVNPLPPVSINPGATVICIGNSATLTASGGSAYVWNNAAISSAITVSPLVNTSYSVTATDANTCTASATASVVVNPLPNAAVNPGAIALCTGASTQLTASGGTGYAWSNGAIIAAITVSPTILTTFSVTVTDANSCTATASGTVAVNPLPNAIVNPAATAICVGNSATLTASGGTSYSWSNASVTAAITVSPLAITTYSVTVTDANTCTATAAGTVTVNPLPVPIINPAIIAICDGASTTLTASGGVMYAWSNAANIAAITVSPSSNTTYSVTVTDANFCSDTASATISVNPLPVAAISPASIQICNGLSTFLTASGGTSYIWSNVSNTAAVNVSPNVTTVFSVTVTDANNCTDTSSATVTVIPSMILSVTGNNVSCNGGNDGSINLTTASGQPPYTYLWNTLATAQNPNGLSQGNYAVTVTDNAGCTAISSATIIEPAPLVLSSSLNNPTCVTNNYDGSITITAAGGSLPYQYGWSNGSNAADLTGIAPGNYALTVTDANNCMADTAFSLAYIYDYTVQASTAVTIKLGEGTTLGYTLSGNAGNFVTTWNFPATLSCSDCASPLAAPKVTTRYKIEVQNNAGCVVSDTVTVTVIPDYAIFIPNAFTPNGDGNNDLFRMYGNLGALQFLEIKIFNRWGELVFESNDFNFVWDGTFKGSRLDAGVLVWQLKSVFIDGHNEDKIGSLTLLR